MDINRAMLNRLRTDLNIALNEIGRKHGVSLSIGSISFTTDRFTCRLTGENGQSGDPNKARAQFAKYAPLYGFSADDYGKKFTVGSDTYFVVSLNPARPKYPVVCERDNGTRYKFPVDAVKMAIK